MVEGNRKRKRLSWNLAGCAVRFSLEASLYPDHDPDDYILTVDGKLYDCDKRMGLIKGFVIQVERAVNDKWNLFDVCDSVSDVIPYFEDLFYEDGDLKESVERQFGPIWGDILILHTVEVLPRYRGRRLGLAAANCFIDTFGSVGDLVVGRPWPLQFGPDDEPDHFVLHPSDWHKKMQIEKLIRNRKVATKKLQDYWAQLGMERLKGSNLYALPLGEWPRPTVTQLLKPSAGSDERPALADRRIGGVLELPD